MAGFEVIIYGRFWVIAEACTYCRTNCFDLRPINVHAQRL
jgi:hypothetical protein